VVGALGGGGGFSFPSFLLLLLTANVTIAVVVTVFEPFGCCCGSGSGLVSEGPLLEDGVGMGF